MLEDNITYSITTNIPEFEIISAPYIRLNARHDLWSDHPEDGILSFLGVDLVTGDITTPLTANQYIAGYVIEFNSAPPVVPEPTSLALLGLGVIGFGMKRKRRTA